MRSSIHLTGRPPHLRDSSDRDVAAARAALAAEAAAVRLATSRTLFGGRLKTAPRASAMWNCDWKLPWHVSVPSMHVPLADHAEGLERVGAEAVPAELLGDHVSGVFERRVDVAPGEDALEHHVGAVLVEHARAIGRERRVCVGDRGQRIVLDVDELERVLGDVAR